MANAAKPKAVTATPAKAVPAPLAVHAERDETESQSFARVSLSPTFLAATAIERYTPVGNSLPLSDLIGELNKQVVSVQGGNLARAESLLVSQAHTLDAIFNQLASRAAQNMGEYMGAAETYLRLALKAQSQCRTTLETLAAIKNPTAPTFVRQANIANGPQQVNNVSGSSAEPPSSSPKRTHAGTLAREKSKIAQNEVLEITHEQSQRLDCGASQSAVGAHSAVEAVAVQHRPKDRRGQGYRRR